jgi:pimeloyl-ACP methyl ester carboxylesterase
VSVTEEATMERRRPTTEPSTTRFVVPTDDGGSLAVWVVGEGPPIVLVHGSLSDHSIFDPLVDELAARMTTYSMDRRGFGASPDTPGYDVEREFVDVAAVVEAVAARTGGTVALFGHSWGASCAMGGAARTVDVDHVVLYEPSLGLAYPEGWIDAVDAMLAAGERDASVVAVLADLLELSDDDIDELRASPRWDALLAGVHTVAREARAESGWVYRPGQFASVTAATLLLAGSDSPSTLAEATHLASVAIVGSRVHILEGHAHLALNTDPALVAGIVMDFVASK